MLTCKKCIKETVEIDGKKYLKQDIKRALAILYPIRII